MAGNFSFACVEADQYYLDRNAHAVGDAFVGFISSYIRSRDEYWVSVNGINAYCKLLNGDLIFTDLNVYHARYRILDLSDEERFVASLSGELPKWIVDKDDYV